MRHKTLPCGYICLPCAVTLSTMPTVRQYLTLTREQKTDVRESAKPVSNRHPGGRTAAKGRGVASLLLAQADLLGRTVLRHLSSCGCGHHACHSWQSRTGSCEAGTAAVAAGGDGWRGSWGLLSAAGSRAEGNDMRTDRQRGSVLGSYKLFPATCTYVYMTAQEKVHICIDGILGWQ